MAIKEQLPIKEHKQQLDILHWSYLQLFVMQAHTEQTFIREKLFSLQRCSCGSHKAAKGRKNAKRKPGRRNINPSANCSTGQCSCYNQL
jgi:hypothetical protein